MSNPINTVHGIFHHENCINCGIGFMVSDGQFRMMTRYDDKTDEGSSFYCPSCRHCMVYSGTSEVTKERRKRERLQQQMARKDDAIAAERKRADAAERSAAAQKGVTTKLKKRAAAGTCLHCNRTFKQLAAHMKNKHPEHMKDQAHD